MYGLSLGVTRIGDGLPGPVYALLSGLNGATTGIIALTTVQLARKAITDKLSLGLVFLDGVVGMFYTALWFFLVLMLAAGFATMVWDFRWLHRILKPLWRQLPASVRGSREEYTTGHGCGDEILTALRGVLPGLKMMMMRDLPILDAS
jgi:chromate transport protein ChrA